MPPPPAAPLDPNAPARLSIVSCSRCRLIPTADEIKQRAMKHVPINVRNKVPRPAPICPSVSARLPTGPVYSQAGRGRPPRIWRRICATHSRSRHPGVRSCRPICLGRRASRKSSCAAIQAAPIQFETVQLPTSGRTISQQLFVQQMSVYAKSYLRDLRRDSVVETR